MAHFGSGERAAARAAMVGTVPGSLARFFLLMYHPEGDQWLGHLGAGKQRHLDFTGRSRLADICNSPIR